MQGVPVTRAGTVGTVTRRPRSTLRIGHWPSGLYFARLTAADGRVGFAPFIVRPRRLGEHRVAVVLPTMTWQAYNLRDDDGDGRATPGTRAGHIHTVRLVPAVPQPWRARTTSAATTCRFLHWLAWTGQGVDFLSDADLDASRARRARRAPTT